MKFIKSNPLIAVLILIIIILIVWYIVKNKKSNNVSVISVFPLKYGSSGTEVVNLQKYLNTNNNCGIVPDGIFGKDTETCVQDIFGTTSIDEVTYKKIISDSSLSSLQNLINTGISDIGGFFG